MRKTIIIAAFTVMITAPAMAQEARDWHLLTKSHSGTVSLIKEMTQRECEFSRARVLGQQATDEEREAQKAREAFIAKHKDLGWLSSSYMVTDSQIETAECFK